MGDYYSVWLYHILFILSSADRYLNCFHLLVTVNDAAMGILYKYLFEHLFSIISGICLGGGLAGSRGNSV